MSNAEITTYLKDQNLLLVDKEAFLDFMVEVNLRTQVDKRVKWLKKSAAIAKYGITRHWLDMAEKNSFSVLQVQKGKGVTAPKKYLEQSIIDEQTRQSL